MTPDNAVVRKATPADRDAILALVLAAFSSVDHDGHEEVEIVTSTWGLGATALDLELVAVMDEVIVGYVLAAWGDLGGRDVVAVAPLAVLPSHQGLGIGTALMTELLRQAEVAALPLVVLLGHPEFYDRFRFEASGPLGIAYCAVGEGNPHFTFRCVASEVTTSPIVVSSPIAGNQATIRTNPKNVVDGVGEPERGLSLTNHDG